MVSWCNIDRLGSLAYCNCACKSLKFMYVRLVYYWTFFNLGFIWIKSTPNSSGLQRHWFDSTHDTNKNIFWIDSWFNTELNPHTHFSGFDLTLFLFKWFFETKCIWKIAYFIENMFHLTDESGIFAWKMSQFGSRLQCFFQDFIRFNSFPQQLPEKLIESTHESTLPYWSLINAQYYIICWLQVKPHSFSYTHCFTVPTRAFRKYGKCYPSWDYHDVLVFLAAFWRFVEDNCHCWTK